MNKLYPALLCVSLLLNFGCSQNTDPIVAVSLTEKRGEYRLETTFHKSGAMFRGYYHESSNLYEKQTEAEISDDIINQIWSALENGKIKRKLLSQEPEGDFKSIGVVWDGGDSSYGANYSYADIPPLSPLLEVLEIIQANQLDNWVIPEK